MQSTESLGVVVAEEDSPASSYVEWGPVFAGAVLASAISLVLFTFGGGVGMTIVSPFSDGASIGTLSYITLGWVIIVMIFSFIAGGYITGRLRRPRLNATEDEVDFRDGAHGLVVWAMGMLIGALLASQLFVSAASVGATGVANAGELAGANTALRGEDSVSVEERQELAAIFASALADGSLSEDDRDYAADVIAESTDLSEQEAQTRVSAWETQSREAAKHARAVGAISAFLLAASALVAAAAAYFAAGLGGNHRDANSPFPWTRARAIK